MRLPVLVEAWVYLQHLHAKRKNLARGSAPARLTGYAVQPSRGRRRRLGPAHGRGADEPDPGCEALLADASAGLDAALTVNGPLRPGLRGAWGRVFLAPPRKNRLVCVMGCDGAGKTTLAGALAERDPAIRGVFTGKHLYRKSYLFKLLVIFVRPLLGQTREGFDERLAPLVYLRACWGMRIKHWRGRRLLIDRALPDFLYRHRKTDRPRFSVWRGLMGWAGLRVPTVHCVVDFDRVAQRKELEVTRAGHAAYNRDMFDTLARRTPSFYLAFNNDGTLEDSVAALASCRIMKSDRRAGAPTPSSHRPTEGRTNLKTRTRAAPRGRAAAGRRGGPASGDRRADPRRSLRRGTCCASRADSRSGSCAKVRAATPWLGEVFDEPQVVKGTLLIGPGPVGGAKLEVDHTQSAGCRAR